jgi:DNA-binding CsgD family transcriptional regulator
LRDPLDANLPVLVAPFRASGLDLAPEPLVAVILSDPDDAKFSAEAVARIFGLTPPEGRLVAALATGQSLAGYARRAAISVNTAKSQLRSVFAKTETSSQSALVGAVLAHPVLRLSESDRVRQAMARSPRLASNGAISPTGAGLPIR